jgi:hypothetical protein
VLLNGVPQNPARFLARGENLSLQARADEPGASGRGSRPRAR